MTLDDFLLISFVENGGIDGGSQNQGLWRAEHATAVQDALRQYRTLGGHTDVDGGVDGTAGNDMVLYKAAGSRTWTVKRLSEIRPVTDSAPAQGSENPVSSGGVWASLEELRTAIGKCATATDVEKAIADIAKNAQGIGTLAGRVTAAEGGIESLGGTVTSQGSRIDLIEAQLNAGVGARTLGELENVDGAVDTTATDRQVLVQDGGSSQWKRAALAGLVDLSGKFGFVEWSDGAIRFYDEENGTLLQSLTLSGTVYNISVLLRNGTQSVFSVLTGDGTCPVSFSASTTAGALGETPSAFPENYTYVIAVDSGVGYVNCASGSFAEGETATLDIFPYLSTGQNRIRITVTGVSSGQSKSASLTGTLTNLTLTLNHEWQNVWYEGSAYVLNRIRFSGSVQKTLHVKIYHGATSTELTKVYAANENYTTVTTNYAIPAEDFPPAIVANADGTDAASGVYQIEVWLSSGSIETAHTIYNIMCVVADGTSESGYDETPLVCVNNISGRVYNYRSDTVFSYACYRSDSIMLQPSVSFDGTDYDVQALLVSVEGGVAYDYAPSLEIDINSEAVAGTMATAVTPYLAGVAGTAANVSQVFDNSLAFRATGGAVFYMNAASRSNSEGNRDVIVNQATGASVEEYAAVWTGFGWSSDAWVPDAYGHRALTIPARCRVAVPSLAPLRNTDNGLTLELLVRSANIADEETPVLSFLSGSAAGSTDTRQGFALYPTKVVVFSSAHHDEEQQGVGLCENVITHIAVTIQKNYNDTAGKNLCTIYINGIPNVSFDFLGSESFGEGSLLMGQDNTDFHLYMMRVYETALGDEAVLANFYNAIFDGGNTSHGEYDREKTRELNNIVEGVQIDYALARARGYNCMVIEPDNAQAAIPDFYHRTSIRCTMYFEYWGTHPEWNVKITNVPLDGQGTTSMRYYRWNLRGKLGSCNWYYANAQGAYDEVPTFENSKTGFLDGYVSGSGVSAGGHLMIERFTAKKNVASSQQGHKMGATALYDDLFTQIGLKDELPDSSVRVAVWQYPFLGFVKRGSSYEFIGLYTAGPDKGCKVTFGYKKGMVDGVDYSKCMCIEGPNHNPRGTRFLHPWVDVEYVAYDSNGTKQETLMFGGEEGWDDDYSAGIDSDTKDASEVAQILAMYESEWKPAYDLVFHCSPYIASIQEMLASNPAYGSMADVNADITNFLAGTTTYMNEDGVSTTRANNLMSYYDGNYDIWFYRNKTQQFENLSTVEGGTGHRITTYLGLPGTPMTQQILAARKAKMKAELGNYFSVDQTLYHKCYCLLIGAKDNDAKNSYPQKHLKLSDGGRWGWKQDDLDSIFNTDNNGMATVKYSAECADTISGTPIFQGSNSALWTAIWEWYPDELATMMSTMMSAMSAMAATLGISGNNLHEDVYNVLAHYFFGHSALYFPAIAYQHDRAFTYIEPWFLAGTTDGNITYDSDYNGVKPLSQALGDRYQDERLWMERRIAYLFSKYSLETSTGGPLTGYGTVSFALASAYTFALTPAIDFYPQGNVGGNSISKAGRTLARESAAISLTADAQSPNYINGADWLYSLGDLKDMVLSSRGGASGITFSVTSARMHDLKVGDAVAADVLFNATELVVAGASFVTIDARNVTSLARTVDLSKCPRLQTALFGGSTALGLMLAAGSRVERVSFPLYMPTLFLHTLNFLTEENMILDSAALAYTDTYYFNCCDHLNGIGILSEILAIQGNVLRYVSMQWNGTVNVTDDEWAALVALASGTDTSAPASGTYHRVVYSDGTLSTQASQAPHVSGAVFKDSIKQGEYDAVTAAFPDLTVGYRVLLDFLDFEDSRVWEICAYNWGDTRYVEPGGVLTADHASGKIVADGSGLVVCDHVFASCLVHPARTYTDGTAKAQVAAAARTFEVTLEFDTPNPFSGIAEGSTVIEVRQYAGNTSTQVVVGTVALEDAVLDGDNRITITTSGTTNACQYLTVGVLADSGVTAQYGIRVSSASASGVYQPVGITKAQCAAVSSLGNVWYNAFSKNWLITSPNYFLHYFTGMTQTPYFTDVPFRYMNIPSWMAIPANTDAFRYHRTGHDYEVLECEEGFTTAGSRSFWGQPLGSLTIFPSTTTEFYAEFGYYAVGGCTVIMKALTPPDISKSSRPTAFNAYIYVPDESYDDYVNKWNTNPTNNRTVQLNRIKKKSELPEVYKKCWPD